MRASPNGSPPAGSADCPVSTPLAGLRAVWLELGRAKGTLQDMQSMGRSGKPPHLLEVLMVNQEHHNEQRQVNLHLWQQPSRFKSSCFRPLGWAARRASAGPISLHRCAAHLQHQGWGLREPGRHEVMQLPSEHSIDTMAMPGVGAQASASTNSLHGVQAALLPTTLLTNTE